MVLRCLYGITRKLNRFFHGQLLGGSCQERGSISGGCRPGAQEDALDGGLVTIGIQDPDRRRVLSM